MYFGDWLRNSEVKNLFYLSVYTDNLNFPKDLSEELGRDCRMTVLHPACIMIETLKSMKFIEKRCSRVLRTGDKAVLVYPVHKTVDHKEIGFSSDADEDLDEEG